MDGETVAEVGIVRLDTQRMARVVEAVGIKRGLHKGILHRQVAAQMVLIAVPIDICLGVQAVLADFLRHCKERVAHLRRVLDIRFFGAADAHEGIDIPNRLLIHGLEVLEAVYRKPLVAVIIPPVAGIELVAAPHTEI